MLADDRDYLSWMTTTALAVLMIMVMFWIRSQIPDERTVAAVPPTPAAAALSSNPTPSTVPAAEVEPARQMVASMYECVHAGHLTLSDRPCGPGALVRDIGVPDPDVMTAYEGSVLQQR